MDDNGDVKLMAEGEGNGRPAGGSNGTAGYIADLTAELAGMARGADLGFLAHLLDIARLEAASSAKPARAKTRKA